MKTFSSDFLNHERLKISLNTAPPGPVLKTAPPLNPRPTAPAPTPVKSKYKIKLNYHDAVLATCTIQTTLFPAWPLP